MKWVTRYPRFRHANVSVRNPQSQPKIRPSAKGPSPASNRSFRLLANLGHERRGGAFGDFVFPSRIDHLDHRSTRQNARLVDEWATAIGFVAPNTARTHCGAQWRQ